MLGEVKNYDLATKKGESRLIAKLKSQIKARRTHGPFNVKQQAIILDARGQTYRSSASRR